MMQYSREFTENLANSLNSKECLEEINSLIDRESRGNITAVFLDNTLVLDMDCVERKSALNQNRNIDKSMDSAFIVVDKTTNKTLIILAEFRFNYASMRNLDRNSLIGKVAGSESLLSRISEVYNEYYFIFHSNLKQQAINRLNRMNPRIPQTYIACDIHDLKDKFFS